MILERFRLDGRVAAVTGAGQGIGAATARALAEAGAHMVCLDIDEGAAGATATCIAEAGLSAEAGKLDVTRSAEAEAVAGRIVARNGRVDVLVNNAGIAISGVPAEEMTDDVWRKVLVVNLDGVFYCARAFGRHMLAAGRGAVVNIGSISGDIVNRPQEQCQYNASKAGVHHLTRSLAAEWAARGVRVNAVAPTYIETSLAAAVRDKSPDMYERWIDSTPMGRMGRPDEVAAVVVFLASDAASLMTGSIVTVDGGYTCW